MTPPRPKPATLQQIGKRALTDRQFFESLVRDTDKTLADNGLVLHRRDLSMLKNAFRGRTRSGFDLKEFIQQVHAKGFSRFFDTWEADWLRGWLP